MSNQAKVVHGDSKLAPEDAKQKLLRTPVPSRSPSDALSWARKRAYEERHGKLPPVFPTVQTKQCQPERPSVRKTLREELIAKGVIKTR